MMRLNNCLSKKKKKKSKPHTHTHWKVYPGRGVREGKKNTKKREERVRGGSRGETKWIRVDWSGFVESAVYIMEDPTRS